MKTEDVIYLVRIENPEISVTDYLKGYLDGFNARGTGANEEYISYLDYSIDGIQFAFHQKGIGTVAKALKHKHLAEFIFCKENDTGKYYHILNGSSLLSYERSGLGGFSVYIPKRISETLDKLNCDM